jgi:hypothetical protein
MGISSPPHQRFFEVSVTVPDNRTHVAAAAGDILEEMAVQVLKEHAIFICRQEVDSFYPRSFKNTAAGAAQVLFNGTRRLVRRNCLRSPVQVLGDNPVHRRLRPLQPGCIISIPGV